MELIQMIQITNMKIEEVNKSINTVGQTLSDFIEFNKEDVPGSELYSYHVGKFASYNSLDIGSYLDLGKTG